MKITICGSVKFADRLVDIYNKLKELGHEPLMHEEMFGIADGSNINLINDTRIDHAEAKRKNNFIKIWYTYIKKGDAILVCNFDKHGIRNYIGGNVFLEIGFAHVNDKKVFLLNPMPNDIGYADEIKAMVDVVINGDLNRIGKEV